MELGYCIIIRLIYTQELGIKARNLRCYRRQCVTRTVFNVNLQVSGVLYCLRIFLPLMKDTTKKKRFERVEDSALFDRLARINF